MLSCETGAKKSFSQSSHVSSEFLPKCDKTLYKLDSESFKNAYKGEDVGDSALSTMPVFNEQHRFYYFPKMKTTEALVFKQLDTRNHSAIACPHTSFDNVNASSNAKPRRSIEIRVMCAFSPN